MYEVLISPDENLTYWVDKLTASSSSGFYELAESAADSTTPRGRLLLPVPASLTAQLLACAKGKDLNVYKLGLAALAILLHKYTLHEELLLTTTDLSLQAGKPAGPGLQFVCLTVKEDDSPKSLLARLHQELEQNLARQQFDYAALVAEQFSQPALARLAFATGFHYAPLNPWQSDLDKVQLLCKLDRDEEILRLEIDYDTACYSARAVELLAQQLLRTLELLTADLAQPVAALNPLTALDQELILGPFNNTERVFPTASVIEQFEWQAAATPDAVAVKSNGLTLTYRELNERGNQVAHYLRNECGLQHQEKVAVMVHRSERIIIGIIGILKAGGWYIPIDLSSPPERIQFFISDSECRLVLTEAELLTAGLTGAGSQLFCVEDCLDQPIDTPARHLADFDLAYMIYTSGTTGKPKGALVYHLSLANHVNWFRRQFALTPSDSTMLINSYSFDGCYSYIWATLTAGGTLHVPTDTFFDPDQTLAYIKQQGVTFLKVVPSTFGVLVNSRTFNEDPTACRTVRVIKQGGETINVKNLRKYLGHYPHVVLGNHYGATEATIGSVAHWLTRESMDEFAARPVLGSPFDNQQIYVLDPQNQLLPVGVSGQICIGGIGVGNGYYNRPELTAAKFIANPFGEGRLYKTGDQGRWLPDGTLAFSGRIDNQVKIRGFRIELDEIAETLKLYGPVRDAVALVHEVDGQPQLAVYFAAEAALALAELQEHLRSQLPDYMLPAYYVPVATIPLTPNGKLDKHALPDAEAHRLHSEQARVAPATETEAQLLSMWQEILNLQHLGTTDNFFEIGGHSLKATQLVAQIHRAFNVRLPLRTIFLRPTIQQLATALAEADTEQYHALRPVPPQPHYELSHAQMRLWVITGLEPGQIAYNIPHAVELRGELNVAAMAQAFTALIDRHEVLRTVFPIIDGVPRQRVVKVEEFGFALQIDDLRGHMEADAEASRLARNEAQTVFDLAAGPLVKARLLQLTATRTVLLFTLHHIVSDGWSTQVLFRDILTLYRDFQRAEPCSLRPLPVQYKDVTAWQNQQLRSEQMQVHRAYWLKQFEGELPVLELPTDFARPKAACYEGDYRTLTLDGALSQQLTHFAAARGVSMFMLLLAGVKTLLYRYTGQKDIIVGSPIAGREHADLADQVGFYVNTLPIRSQLSGEATFGQYLTQIQEHLLRAYQHQAHPFDELIDQLNLPRDNGHSPLFDVLVVMQNNGSERDDLFAQSEFEAVPYNNDNPTSKFDLTIDCAEETEGLVIGIEYRTAIFTAARVERMLLHLAALLRHVMQQPDTALDAIPYLAVAERAELLDLAGSTAPVPVTHTVSTLFAAQAARTPNALAIADERRQLSYNQLNDRTTRLANYLRQEHGIRHEDVVATVMQRGTDFVVSMLATLKADAAYLPLEAHTPVERIRELLAYTQARVVVTDNPAMSAALAPTPVVCLPMLDLSTESWAAPLPASQATTNSLAYVMFTSGSTGRPKGVMIEHRSIIRLVRDTDYTRFDERLRVLQTGSLAFDAATFEIWGPLLHGGQLHLLSLESLLDTEHLRRSIREKGITQMWFTSSWFNQLADEQPDVFSGLEQVLVGGEALSARHLARVQQYCPQLQIINGYGPTENTTFSVCGAVATPATAPVPLGRPIANSIAYVVDGRGNLVPKGVPGELWLGGEGLARGYWQDAERTRQQFVPNPFGAGRLYRSGDLARWGEDGQLEFLGRVDNQIKIRGFRIEPDEIAEVLRGHSLVKDAVVTVHLTATGEKFLAGYFSAEDDLSAEAVRRYLQELLPAYMVPAALLALPELPLNANGKIDRKALPAPTFTTPDYVPPTTGDEQVLAQLWAEVLGLDAEAISAEANFFELGGHSLKAIKLVGLVHRRLGVALSLAQVFELPTIRLQAACLAASDHTAYQAIEPAPVQQTYSLSSAQSRLYFLQRFEPTSTAYNVPGILALPAGADSPAHLQAALQALVARHDSLRTSFEDQQGTVVQRVQAEVDISVAELPVGSDASTALADFVRPFDLGQAPLLRAAYLPAFAGQPAQLLFDVHHIVTDGLSQAILQAELLTLLQGKPLSGAVLQYKDYLGWQASPARSTQLQAQQSYWQAAFADERPILQLPTDFARPEQYSSAGAEVSLTLSSEETAGLHALCRRHDVTPYMAMLAVWSVLLTKLSGQADVTVGTPVAGRVHPDAKQIVGLFVNTLPLRSLPSGDKLIADYLREVKLTALGAFEHQEYPFEELVEYVGGGRDMSRNPLFDTAFGLLSEGEFAHDVDALSSTPSFDPHTTVSKFDLNLRALEVADRLYLSLTYATSLFRPATILRLVAQLRQLLGQLAADSTGYLADLSLLSDAEQEQVLRKFNQTEASFATAGRTYNELFTFQVELTPKSVAVVDETGSLTYRELNAAANRLAAALRRRGVGRNSLVGILLPPSVQTIVAILAVYKAGAAYVPLDQALPSERIGHILEDSQVRLLLADQTSLARLGAAPVEVLDVDDPGLADESSDEQPLRNTPEDLAYVIYTSGSTGKPKGVMVRQRNLVNYVSWYVAYTGCHAADRTVLTGSYSFDFAMTLIFPILTVGGQLHLVPKETFLSPIELGTYIQHHGISFLKLTPTLFSVLLKSPAFRPEWLAGIRHLMLGGELLNVADLRSFFRLYPDKYVINHYGPTETTVGSVCRTFTAADMASLGAEVAIGQPINNLRAYVLDAWQQPVPVGVIGQLYMGGAGVAAGYLHRPELTAERFIASPFVVGDTLYATGDLVKWLPDGTLVCLGRADHQVKIRGHRVELGEIERVLTSHTLVGEACVSLRRDADGDLLLAAFVTAPTAGLSSEQLRRYAQSTLPEYMVPAYIGLLDVLPMTPNGKLDRQCLDQLPLEMQHHSTAADYEPPVTITEQQVQAVWETVLNQRPVSVTANFFEMGGHSLKALKTTMLIHRETGVEVPLRQFFQQPTIRQLATWLDGQARGTYDDIPLAPLLPYYPLSHAQMRLWVLQQLDEQQTSYNTPASWLLRGPLDVALLRSCFQALVNRHEILRTVFRIVDGEPRQVVLALDELPVFFRVQDLSDQPEPWQQVQPLLRELANRVFDLAQGPLLHVTLLRLSAAETVLSLNLHHIVSDGWSVPILHQELLTRYRTGLAGEALDLPALPIQYKDYAYWQHQNLVNGRDAAHLDYWRTKLSGELPVLALPEDFPRPAVKTFNGDYFQYVVSHTLADRLDSLAHAQQASPLLLLLAALKTLFFRYTGQPDIILGTPVAGREKIGLSQQLGLYVNTLALRTQLDGERSFTETLRQERDNALEAFEHRHFPFDQVISELRTQFDPSRSALFDVMVVYQNAGERQGVGLALEGLELEELSEEFNGSKFDMTLVARRVEEGLQFHIEYNTDIYAETSLRRLLAHFEQLLTSIAANADTPLTELNYLDPEEREQVLSGFNQTHHDGALLNSIHAYVEQQVALRPEQPALLFPTGQLSYRQLNEQANQLANWLRQEHGVGANQTVAFVLPRSEWQVITVLGILKAGAAFLPIDPSYPAERVHFILNDARPVLTLVDATAQVPAGYTGLVQVLSELRLSLAKQPTHNPVSTTRPTDLAYIIYTSGSTGTPKGVMIEHRGNMNMVSDQVRRFEIAPSDRCLQFASISFDASVYEMFMSLYTGAGLVLLTPELIANPAHCLDYLQQQQVTVATLPPVYLASLDRERVGQLLRVLITAGEAPNPADARYLGQRLSYYNAYGPTEYSVCATTYRVTGAESVVPIGQPIANTQALVLDAQQQPLPVGVWGELYLSGVGCARGYVGQPELTAQRFLPNPSQPGQTMYRTGDVARWRVDGQLEFRGRVDHQVKIRGYRVELSEIEQLLLTHPAVAQAVVTYAKGDAGTDQLRAYVVASGGVGQPELKFWLAERLPHYMVPTYYCLLVELPVTSNGKVDLRALPQPTVGSGRRAEAVAPATNTERVMASLWEQVLQLPQVGVTDNFYDLGGQSILAMRLIGRIWKTFGVNVSIRDIMHHATIREQAALLTGNTPTKGLLLPLSRGLPGQPVLFMLPPVVGTAAMYQPLARLVGQAGINCYGLQHRGFDDPNEAFDANIEQMAQSFAQEITSVVAGGQLVFLLGYSMGALLAAETARVLEAALFEVELILIDNEPLAASRQLEAAETDGHSADDELLSELLQAHMPAETQAGLVGERMRQLLRHNLQLLHAYRPSMRLAAPLLLLEAADSERSAGRMLRWQDFTSGPVRHQAIAGHHFSLFEAPHLPALADHILRSTALHSVHIPSTLA
ncbi:non-ribosomal peptide synthetase [Hymenobacter actinosclerus]|uniref:Amino acid adenylation domain-containing protein n=1 Tax=Hymenobacter actinosclerus TaxID=82805 RepID=A0A1I0IKD1_9BACT|nr:non-ribosomal peptide synthetase [Hymenobacter actinosclerus]SET96733.1 amino acid adenylation domain-containing protein [Hymenobacter actinosclerus]